MQPFLSFIPSRKTMMRKLCFLLPLLAFVAFGQIQTGTDILSLGTLSAVGATAGQNLHIRAHKHTLQVVVTGTPSGCNIQLEGTLDDATSASPNWANLSGSQACTSSVTFHVADRPVSGVRANLTVLSG